MKQRHPAATRDYTNAFLAAILIGIAVIIGGLMMAFAHATSHPLEGVGQPALGTFTPRPAELTNNVSSLFLCRRNYTEAA